MFGNSKEYHDIQKLYLEKVSKTEDIQEFKSKFSKPQQPVKSPMEAGMGPGAAKARAMAKARIAAKKAASQPKSTPSVDSFKQGMKTPLNVSDTSKPTETKPTETKTTPTYQDNRNKLNQSRQNQNKDRFKKQLGGVKKTIGGAAGAIKSFADRFKAKPIERKEGQTSVRSKSGGVKTGAGTDTETKTNTQIKKMPGSGKEIDPKAKVTQTTSTNDKGQKVTTTTAKTSLQGSDATDAIKQAKERRAKRLQNANEDYGSFDPQISNDLAEIYKNMYNQSVEKENLDEGVGVLAGGVGAAKALGAAMAGVGAGGMLMQKIRRTKSKLNPNPDAGVGGDPEVGKVTTYTKNKKTGKYTKTTKRDKAGEQSASRNYRDPAGDPKMKEVTKDRVQSDVGPIKKTKKGYSILKKRREAAYDKASEQGFKRQRYQEIQQAAKPIKNVGTKNIQQDHYEYEPYDIVLEYLLSSEQAATIEEANYIMTEMDAETIQGIVSEGLGSAI